MLWHIWRRGWSQVPLILNFLITILILDPGSWIHLHPKILISTLALILTLTLIHIQAKHVFLSFHFSTQVDLPRGEQGLLCLNSFLSSLHMQGFSFLSFSKWNLHLKAFFAAIYFRYKFSLFAFFSRQTQSQRNQYHEELFVLLKACTSPLKLWPADKVGNFIL